MKQPRPVFPWSRAALGAVLLLASLVPARADPGPGDVFREYIWQPPLHGNGLWLRATGPDATNPGALKFLPNPVNTIELADLEGATRVEVQVELLQCHVGTIGQAVRVNGAAWVLLPPPKLIPGDAGSEAGIPELWQTMRYPTVDLPLADLKTGANTFEFTSQRGPIALGRTWPQSLVYGVIFRIYYGAGKAAPAGRVLGAQPLEYRHGFLALAAEAGAAPGRTVRRVDFLARYEGYDWRGEGVWLQYHYNTEYGALRRHAGTASAAPWRVEWDTRWVPAQPEPVQVVARIEDDRGLCTITAPTVLDFRGSPDVRMFRSDRIPPKWSSRIGRRFTSRVKLPDDLSRLREARVIFASWSGEHAGAIGVNGLTLVGNVGRQHELSYDELTVPVGVLQPGENEFFTTSATKHHGIELLWPAFVVLARFAPAEAGHAAP